MEEPYDKKLKTLDLRGLGEIFTGYILILLDFRIGGFDLFPNIIGYFLIFYGLKKHAGYDSFFEKARPFAAICTALSILDFYQINIKDTPHWVVYIWVSVGLFSMILNLLLYYYIIYGVCHLSSIGFTDEMYHQGDIAFRLLLIMNVLLYPIDLLLLVGGFTDWVIILAVPPIIAQIYFLWFIRNARLQLDGQPFDDNSSAKRQSWLLTVSQKLFSNFICILSALLIVIAAVCGTLYERNQFHVPASMTDAVTVSDESSAIRENMLRSGFLEDDIADMPNDEVLRYRNLKSVKADTDTIDKDGGQCRVTSYYSLLGDKQGMYRVSIAYQWIKQPHNAYGDVIGIEYDDKALVRTNSKEDICSYNLFDKQNKQGDSATYQAKDIETQSVYKMVYKRYPVYYGSGITNQRGYLAFDAFLSKYTEAQCFYSVGFYIHQTSFLTLDERPISKIDSGLSDIDDYDFQYYHLYKTMDYNP